MIESRRLCPAVASMPHLLDPPNFTTMVPIQIECSEVPPEDRLTVPLLVICSNMLCHTASSVGATLKTNMATQFFAYMIPVARNDFISKEGCPVKKPFHLSTNHAVSLTKNISRRLPRAFHYTPISDAGKGQAASLQVGMLPSCITWPGPP